MTPPRSDRKSWRQRRDEAGYAAVLAALLASTVFIGLSALGVDVARWYVEAERAQKTADAAALAGVPFMPNNFPDAKDAALAVAAKNGFDDASPDVTVEVSIGDKPSELKVVISSRVRNAFGGYLGVSSTWVTREATADYTAPAPMGSPCNTFGNEPPGTSAGAQPAGTSLPSPPLPNCPKDPTTLGSYPKFWAGIEGPETDKLQGDRYQANKCTETGNTGGVTYNCDTNSNGRGRSPGDPGEYKEQGYYFIVHVEPAAVGSTLDVQVYDPAYLPGGLYCNGLPTQANLSNTMNDWVADGKSRYGQFKDGSGNVVSASSQKFCPGDSFVGSGAQTSRGTMTTFVMRTPTETKNPDKAATMTSCEAGSPITQFRGYGSLSQNTIDNYLTKGSSTYNDQLARVFHQWYSLCSFRPTVAGDYYLQVRTNVSLGGNSVANTNSSTNSPVIYTGNSAADDPTGNYTQGGGANGFAVRAVPSSASLRDDVAVSAWERMPILQLAASPAVFNLVRALPNAKGQYLTFDFFDAADGADGTVKVLPPADATGDVKLATGIPNCKSGKNDIPPSSYSALTGCSMTVKGTNTDGQLIHMVIPIPQNYNCDNSKFSGCWFQVQLDYNGDIHDFTTWSANIGGDPVRLVE